MLSNASNQLHKEYPGFCNSTKPGAKEELATEFHRENTENSAWLTIKVAALTLTPENPP